MRGRRVAVVIGRVRVPGRVDRAGRRRPAGRRRSSGPPPRGCRCWPRPVSGGTRMQEGTPAFVQMVRITPGGRRAQGGRAALPRLPAAPDHRRRDGVVGLARPRHRRRARRAGRLPRPARLRGALRQAVPRGRADRGEPLRPRHHRRRRRPRARSPTSSTGRSTVLQAPARGHPARCPRRADEPIPDVDTWDAVTRSRRRDRPGVRRLLRYAATDVIPLNGTGQGEADPGLLIALARFGAGAVRVPRPGPARPDAGPPARARRRCARPGAACGWPSELGLPLVTVIDTQGAALSPDAENGGLAGEIARCLSDLVTLRRPDPVPDARRGQRRRRAGAAARPTGWSPPSTPGSRRCRPRARSAIVHRDLDHAPEMARAQQVRAIDLHAARHRRPDRRRAARRRRRARGVLPAGRRGARVRARRAARRRSGHAPPSAPVATSDPPQIRHQRWGRDRVSLL